MKTEVALLAFSVLMLYGIFSVGFITYSYDLVPISSLDTFSESFPAFLQNTPAASTSFSSPQLISNASEYYCHRKKPFFTQEEIKFYWKYKDYSPCAVLTKDRIDVSDVNINATCEGEEMPKYFYDPGEPEYLHKKGTHYVKWRSSTQDLDSSQFVLIKCGMQSVYTRVFFSYRQSVADEAENKRKTFSSNSKPFTIALIILDSVSTMSAQRNLPETCQILETAGNWFKYAKSFSSTTRKNMIPVFYGMNLSYQEELTGTTDMKFKAVSSNLKPFQEKHAIWKHYSDLGYITYFSYDSSFDFLAQSLGKELLTDHKFLNFYKYTQSVYRFNDMTENQRCAGDQGGHKPILDHALKYYKAYNGHLRFGYTHFSSAHEDTGNIRTVDKDLSQFLRDFFEVYKQNQEDFVLFVMSDHGRMNNLLRFDNRGYLDVLNPMMFIVASEGIGNSTVFTKNTQRMVGRFDLHLTLKDLAMFPYGGLKESDYEGLKKNYSAKDVVSLFREEIKESRTCEDIGSSSFECACDGFRDVDFGVKRYQDIVAEIVKAVNGYLEDEARLVEECEKPVMQSFEKAEVYEIRNFENGLESVYKIRYTVQYGITINAEVYFWFEKLDKFLQKFVKISKKPKKTAFLENQIVNFLIWDLKVSGPCEKSSCICNDS